MYCSFYKTPNRMDWFSSCLFHSVSHALHYKLFPALRTYHKFYPRVKSHTMQLQIQNVRNSFIHDNQKKKKKKETAQKSISTINHDTSIHWMNPYNGILFTNKKEQNYWYMNDINESQKYHAEWRSHIQKYVLQWFHLHEVLK